MHRIKNKSWTPTQRREKTAFVRIYVRAFALVGGGGARNVLLDEVAYTRAATGVWNCGGGDFIDCEGATSTSVGTVAAPSRAGAPWKSKQPFFSHQNLAQPLCALYETKMNNFSSWNSRFLVDFKAHF